MILSCFKNKTYLLKDPFPLLSSMNYGTLAAADFIPDVTVFKCYLLFEGVTPRLLCSNPAYS